MSKYGPPPEDEAPEKSAADPLLEELVFAIVAKKPMEEIQKLLDNPSLNINKIPLCKLPVLHLVVLESRVDLLEAVLKKKIDVNPLCKVLGQKTPIQVAAEQGNYELIPLLLKYGARKANLLALLPGENLSDNLEPLIQRLKGKYPVNVKQGKLFYKLRRFVQLMRHRRPQDFPQPYFDRFMEKILSPGGICNGYSGNWLYKKASAKYDLHYMEIEEEPSLKKLAALEYPLPILILSKVAGKKQFWVYGRALDGKPKLQKNDDEGIYAKFWTTLPQAKKIPQKLAASKVPEEIYQEMMNKNAHANSEQIFWAHIHQISLWDEQLRSLGKNDLHNIFRDLLNNLLLFQWPGVFLENFTQDEMNRLVDMVGDNPIEKRFNVPLLVTREEINTFLPNFIPANTMVKFGSIVHAIGCFKEGNVFTIMDPELGVSQAKTIIGCSNLLQRALTPLGTPEGAYIELEMTHFTLPGAKQFPSKKAVVAVKLQLLERIYKARIAKGIIDPINLLSPGGNTQLCLACQMGDEEAVDWCLAKGANVNLGTRIPLLLAAQVGAGSIIKKLLTCGANYDEQIVAGDKNFIVCLPLMMAIEWGRREATEAIIDYLKENAPAKLTAILHGENSLTSCLTSCIKNHHVALIDLLVLNGADLNWHSHLTVLPIILAIQMHDADMVRKLLEYSAVNLKQKNPQGYPLIKALNVQGKTHQDNPLSAAVREGTCAIVEALIAVGADVNFAQGGVSLLKIAIIRNDEQMAKTLLEFGAKVTQAEIDALSKIPALRLGAASGKMIKLVQEAAKQSQPVVKKKTVEVDQQDHESPPEKQQGP